MVIGESMKMTRAILAHVKRERNGDYCAVGLLEVEGETVKAAQVPEWGAIGVKIESEIVGAAEL